MNNTTIIIRSVNERTSKLCQTLIEKEYDKKDIFVINEKPFSNAIRKSFEIGLQQNKKWTLCIDADVLVYPKTIDKLIEFGETTDENVFEIQGLIQDKFFLIKRPAGNHLYRTKLIPEAINLIPDSDKSLRPESDTLKQMVEKGYTWQQTDIIIGLHDYEQYYKDIFRKSMLQAHKHKTFMNKIMEKWETLKIEDADYQIATWGAMWGAVSRNISVDKNFQENEIREILELKNIKEKQEISKFDISITQKQFQKNTDEELQHFIFPTKRWHEIQKKEAPHKQNKKTEKKQAQTLIGKIFIKIGHFIEKVGHKIKTSGYKI